MIVVCWFLPQKKHQWIQYILLASFKHYITWFPPFSLILLLLGWFAYKCNKWEPIDHIYLEVDLQNLLSRQIHSLPFDSSLGIFWPWPQLFKKYQSVLCYSGLYQNEFFFYQEALFLLCCIRIFSWNQRVKWAWNICQTKLLNPCRIFLEIKLEKSIG